MITKLIKRLLSATKYGAVFITGFVAGSFVVQRSLGVLDPTIAAELKKAQAARR